MKTQKKEGETETLESMRGRDVGGRDVTLIESSSENTVAYSDSENTRSVFLDILELTISPNDRLSDQIAAPLSANNYIWIKVAICVVLLGILCLFA